METHTQKFKIRLGLFVAGGLTLFVLAIFIIGKQKNLFNPVFTLTTTFYNISGLQVGNNIRFSGINVGTVDNIRIINDSTVKVDMLIKKEVQQFIKSDCVVAIGAEGLIGDRMLIVSQGSSDAQLVKEGQKLSSVEPVETDAIIASLQITAGSAEIISQQLAEIASKMNSGRGTFGRLIHDTLISYNLRQTMENLNNSTHGLGEIMEAAKQNFLFRGYFNKKSTEEKRVRESSDSSIIKEGQVIASEEPVEMDAIISSLMVTAGKAEIISQQLAEMMLYINGGKGTVGRLIQDSTIAQNFNQTIMNLKNSSRGLDENMEALRHNFLLRGYFKRKEREAGKIKADSLKVRREEQKVYRY